MEAWPVAVAAFLLGSVFIAHLVARGLWLRDHTQRRAAQRRVALLDAQVAATLTPVQALRATRGRLANAVDGLVASSLAERRRIVGLVASEHAARETLAGLQAEQERLTREIGDLEQRQADLQDEWQSQQEQAGALEESLDQLTASKEAVSQSLTAAIATGEALRATMAMQQAQLAKATFLANGRRSEAAALGAWLEAARAVEADAEKTHRELERVHGLLQQELASAEATRAEVEGQMTSLEEQITATTRDLEGRLADAEVTRRMIGDTQTALAHAVRDADLRQRQLARRQALLVPLQQQIAEARAQLLDARQAHAQVELQRADADQLLAGLQAEETTRREQHAAMREQLAGIAREVEVLRAEHAQVLAQTAEVMQRMSAATALLDESTGLRDRAAAELMELEQSRRELSADLRDLRHKQEQAARSIDAAAIARVQAEEDQQRLQLRVAQEAREIELLRRERALLSGSEA